MGEFTVRVGVDGGGTTTRAVLLDEAGHILGRGESASSNHYGVGMSRAARHIVAAIEEALEAAAVRRERVASWGLGVAGACSAAEQALWHEALEPLLGNAPIVVDEDAAAAWAGAFANDLGPELLRERETMAGVICIAGTGANCFGISGYGERARADGLGPLLGDRGSGYAIGEAALRAACRAYDGSGEETALLAAILKDWRLDTVDELVQTVYRPDWERSQVAALVPLVLHCAAQGDIVAQRLLDEAGRDLAATTRAVMECLHVERVAPCGGVLKRDTPVRERWETELRSAIPEVRVAEPHFEAVIGAALLPLLRQHY